jgi:hypothetical protein
MINQITAEVITVGKEEPKVLSLLKNGGKATMCNTSPDLCEQFRNETPEIIPNQTIGYCRLTCVACLHMIRTIANKLS